MLVIHDLALWELLRYAKTPAATWRKEVASTETLREEEFEGRPSAGCST